MSLQTFGVLKKPSFGLASLGIAVLFAFTFLYFDEFLFLAPYYTVYVALDQAPLLGLDLTVSALSGMVMSLSVYQLLNMPKKGPMSSKVGLTGIITAIVAGACPCYYLFPLLAIAGGAGGILGTVGILFNAYEFPIKVAVLGLLAFVACTLEVSLRAYCRISQIG